MDEQAWISEGMRLLAECGVDAVRVERLADRMGTSKVSFYWHFKDRPNFLIAILASWRRQAELNMPERLGTPNLDRLRRLLDLPTLGDPSAFGAGVELAIRHWARSDAQAREAVADIDARRLVHIGLCVAAQMPGDPGAVKAQAFLIYAALLAENLGTAPLAQAGRLGWDYVLERSGSAMGSAGMA